MNPPPPSVFVFNLLKSVPLPYKSVCLQAPSSTAMSPGDTIDHPFLFPQADFKTGPMPSSSFFSWSDNSLTHKTAGGWPAAPGPTRDDRSVQFNHDRVHALVSTVTQTHIAHLHLCKCTDGAGSVMLNCTITHCYVEFGLNQACRELTHTRKPDSV